MTAKTIISKTIKELKESSSDASVRLSKYDNDLVTINQMLDLIKDLNSDIVGFNPDAAFKLLQENNLEIFNMRSVFSDVQNIVEYCIKNDEDINLNDYEDYDIKISELKNNLSLLKEKIEKRLIDTKQKLSNEGDVDNLEKVLGLIEGGNGEYITDDMLMSLYRTIFIKYSLNELMPLYDELFKTKNFSLKLEAKKEASSIDDVIELFAEILPTVRIDEYLRSKKDQILKSINLENARNIIKFFKEKRIINYFDRILLVKIITQADYESVVNTYNNLRSKVPSDSALAAYCCDSASSLWVNNKASKSRRTEV